jgi:hypothetical protein
MRGLRGAEHLSVIHIGSHSYVMTKRKSFRRIPTIEVYANVALAAVFLRGMAEPRADWDDESWDLLQTLIAGLRDAEQELVRRVNDEKVDLTSVGSAGLYRQSVQP